MSITPDQIKTIRTEFSRLKPARVSLDGSRPLTIREAIFALAPTLERMRRRGFELAELTEKLHDKDFEISVPTLARYLNAWRRQKAKRQDTPRPGEQTAAATLIASSARESPPLLAGCGRAGYT